MKSMTASDAKESFGEMLAVAEREPVSITRNGRVVVVAMPADSGERERRLDPTAVDRMLQIGTLKAPSIVPSAANVWNS